jgi:hypothetical protein
MIFVELPLFTKHARFTDEELAAIQKVILGDPLCGDLIPGAHGLRKMRAALAGRGKRGGARVIYYFWRMRDCCYLVFAYAKNEREDMTAAQLKTLGALMREVLRDG